MRKNYRPLFAWPGLDEFKITSIMAMAFIFIFYTFYGFAAYAVDYLPYKFIVGFEWEKQIPFIPETAFVYTSMNWMMLSSIFIIRDRYRMWALLKVLSMQTLIGAIIFLMFPVKPNFPTLVHSTDLPIIYIIADTLNLKNNQLPSLHICFAVTMALIYTKDSNKWQAVGFHIWALAIIVSTFTLHEHNLLDIIGGYILALWGANQWYKYVNAGIDDSHLPDFLSIKERKV